MLTKTFMTNRLAMGMAGLVFLLGTPAFAAKAAPKPPSEIRFAISPLHAMVPVGEAVDISILVTDLKGQPVHGSLALKTSADGAPANVNTLALGPDGMVTFHFVPTANVAGIYTNELKFPKGSEQFYIDVLPKAEYDAFAKAAAAVRFEKLPAHLLFIGDSLTDFFRGQNYVDKIGFWLRKQYGEQATVKNAGVGGDYITRVWDRLNHEPKAFRLSMFDDLYQPVPTRVFFFLGHNDSKLSSTSDYKTATVEPAQFEELYRKSIKKVQAETKARITVISATSSVYETTKATADKSREQGKSHNLFGKPEALEQFNALAQKVAKECSANYLDVYTPTKQAPNKPALFIKDGVHLSNLGNRLIALEVLKELGKE